MKEERKHVNEGENVNIESVINLIQLLGHQGGLAQPVSVLSEVQDGGRSSN